MRRCPACQAPNPENAPACHVCGQLMPALEREPWLRLDDFWQPQILVRILPPLAVLLALRLSLGSLLTAGHDRQEWRFLLFHVLSGLVLGAGLAWVRGLSKPLDWAFWVATGLAGGLLCEALEVWYTYRHLMGTLTFYAWQWFQLPETPALIYRILQGLRALGLALPLLLLAWQGEKRLSRGLFALFCVGLAVAFRVPVRGAFVHWGGLGYALGLQATAFYALSALALFYGLGLKALTPGPKNR